MAQTASRTGAAAIRARGCSTGGGLLIEATQARTLAGSAPDDAVRLLRVAHLPLPLRRRAAIGGSAPSRLVFGIKSQSGSRGRLAPALLQPCAIARSGTQQLDPKIERVSALHPHSAIFLRRLVKLAPCLLAALGAGRESCVIAAPTQRRGDGNAVEISTGSNSVGLVSSW